MPEDDPEARRRALRALATGGTQAKLAEDEFTRQIRGDQAAAAKAALADAVRIDAPEAAAELQPRIEAPFDRYATAAGSANQSRLATLRQMEAANRSYMSQVAAARPVVEGLARAKAAERAAKAAKPDELSDAELTNRLMGAARLAQREALPSIAALPSAARDTGNILGGGPGSPRPPAQRGSLAASINTYLRPVEETARRIGTAAGVDPSRVFGVVPDAPKPKAAPVSTRPYPVRDAAARVGIADPTPLVTRATRVVKGYKDADDRPVTGKQRPFDDAVATAEDAAKARWTAAQLNETLADAFTAKYGQDFPDVRKLILASYGHLLGGV